MGTLLRFPQKIKPDDDQGWLIAHRVDESLETVVGLTTTDFPLDLPGHGPANVGEPWPFPYAIATELADQLNTFARAEIGNEVETLFYVVPVPTGLKEKQEPVIDIELLDARAQKKGEEIAQAINEMPIIPIFLISGALVLLLALTCGS